MSWPKKQGKVLRMNKVKFSVVGLCILTITSIAMADTLVGKIDVFARGYGDDSEECCSRVSINNPQVGGKTDAQKSCFNLGGSYVSGFEPNGYCTPHGAPKGGWVEACLFPSWYY